MTPAEIKKALVESGALYAHLGVRNSRTATLSDLGPAPRAGTTWRDEWEERAVRLGVLCGACGEEMARKDACPSCGTPSPEYYVEPEPWAVALLALLDRDQEILRSA